MRGEMDMLIMFCLNRHGKLNGYGMRKAISEMTGSEKSFGAIYPALKRLEQKGWVKKEVEGRSKFYFLTAEGRARMKGLRKKQEMFMKRVDELLAAMSSMFRLPVSEIRPLFSRDFPYRKEMFRLALSASRAKKRHEKSVRRILEDARRRIESL